ncbi:MAG: SAM-dependent methyltransferase [Candidatus Omnitrophica bacterium CG11_big_fil_rev_8_21_14_0_20_64_10]|nr:MAG: SAM-dependent methyltransferase [Candidatus Omnitrophica bacterium CG11_big_fil_rev_8_21_14_0_20_64_10]
MDAKRYYEWYNRDDPSSLYRPEDEITFAQRLSWFSKNIPPKSRILDYGCGEGVLLAELHKNGIAGPESCGVDISENAVGRASIRFPYLRFLATHPNGITAFPDGSFDTVIATEVVEHVFDTDATFSEFHRLLRPGGTLLLSCPYHGFLKDLVILLTGRMDAHYHDPYSPHIRYYTPATLLSVHRKHGFRLVKQDGVGRFPCLWNSMVTAAVKQPV